MDEEIVCVECLAEPCYEDGRNLGPDLDGWDFDGEFGARCPECSVQNVAISPVEGLEAIAAASGVKKRPTRILVDMDGIIVNLLQNWLTAHNAIQGDDLTVDKILTWDTHLYAKGEHKVYKPLEKPGFFSRLNPLDGAVEALTELVRRGHEVFLVTAAMYPCNISDKMEWVAKYLPFIDKRHLIFAHNKHLLKADAIIDDGPHNATDYAREHPEAKVIGIGYPYNKECKAYTLLAGDWRDTKAAWEIILKEFPENS